MVSNKISLISILILLSLVEIIPYLITIIFPNLCYGCTKIGKYHQKMNYYYNLSSINWSAYTLLIIYYIRIKQNLNNKLLKNIMMLVGIFLIYLPTFPLLNIITLVLSGIYINPPFIEDYSKIFPDSVFIEKNADIIINEFKTYNKNILPDCIRKSNPGFKIENSNDNDSCWRAIFLKKLGVLDNSMIKYFPETIKLLQSKQIHNAFFSILDPGVEIPPHVGYYKGYLRYHMGIIIPNNDSSNENDKAYIVCGNKKYIWKEKKGIVFDDMYLHYVRNPTNQMRVVLYLDIKRKNKNVFIDKINDTGIFLIENSILLNTFIKNQHGQSKIKNLN